MSSFIGSSSKDLSSKISNHISRYGIAGTSLILSIDLIWAASLLIPVLFVIGFLFQYTNAWMAVLPGMLGAITFLILLAIGGLAATLPSNYVGKWRNRVLDRIAARYPALPAGTAVAPVIETLPHGFEMQDAD